MHRAPNADLQAEYLLQDARQLSRTVKANSVDVIITSPPYWNLKDYGNSKQIGFGQSWENYLTDLDAVFAQCHKALRQGGSMWVVVDTFKTNGDLKLLPFEIAQRLKSSQHSPWLLQDLVIWEKDKTLPWSRKGQFRDIFEYVLFFTKTSNFRFHIDRVKSSEDLKGWWAKYPERYNPDGKAPTGIWRMPLVVQGWGSNWIKHSCPLPPEMIERILQLTTDEGDTVLDPFAGSGVVLAQSESMGRRAVGFDVNPEYRARFYDTVRPEVLAAARGKTSSTAEKQDERTSFREQIVALRKLKYPVQLQKIMMQSGAPMLNRIHSFLVFSPSIESEECSILAVHAEKDLTSHNFNLDLLSNHTKLKNFKLEVELEAVGVSEALRRLSTKREIYLYDRGMTHRAIKKMTKPEITKFYSYAPTTTEVPPRGVYFPDSFAPPAPQIKPILSNILIAEQAAIVAKT